MFVSTRAVIPTGAGPYLLLTETGGAAPLRTHNSVATPAYQRPSAQILVTGGTYAAALTMVRAAYDALAGVRNTTISGTFYQEISPTQEPMDLGPDASGRVQLAFNVNVVKRPSS